MQAARDGRDFIDAFYAARVSAQSAEAFVAKLPMFITACAAEATVEFMIAHLDEITKHVENLAHKPWVYRAVVVVRSAEDIKAKITAHVQAMQTASMTATIVTRAASA